MRAWLAGGLGLQIAVAAVLAGGTFLAADRSGGALRAIEQDARLARQVRALGVGAREQYIHEAPQAEIELLVALAGAVAPVVGKARIVDAPSTRPAGPATVRRVTLTGRMLAPGRALGEAMALRRPSVRTGLGEGRTAQELGRAFDRVVLECDATLESFLRAARRKSLDTTGLELARMILADGRLRERTLELAGSRGLVTALGRWPGRPRGRRG